MIGLFADGLSNVWLQCPSPLWPVTSRMPGPPPGFVAGIDMLRTDSLMICRMVFRKAFLKSAVLQSCFSHLTKFVLDFDFIDLPVGKNVNFFRPPL